MKIAISVTGNAADSQVDPRFGRAVGFVIHDTTAEGENQYIDNAQNLNAMQGAGIQAAKTVSDAGVDALITGHCGPKAFMSLKTAGIKVYTGAEGTVADAIEKFKNGELEEARTADVQGHW